jgi:hypothetical protein
MCSSSLNSPQQTSSPTLPISYDGVHFSSITPESQFDLGGNPFWYRALLERLDSNFNLKSTPVATPGQDPEAADYYKLGNMSAVDVGNNILERTINLDLLPQTVDTGSRPILLREVPLPGTLSVYQGTALLGPQEYQFTNNAVNFSGNDARSGVVIRYQTSVYANAGLLARREYYTPRLYQVSLERVL